LTSTKLVLTDAILVNTMLLMLYFWVTTKISFLIFL